MQGEISDNKQENLKKQGTIFIQKKVEHLQGLYTEPICLQESPSPIKIVDVDK